MDLKEKKLTSALVYDGVLLKLYRDDVALPDGEKSVREWIDHPGAAAVIPLVEDGQVLLVRQFRYPIGRETLEIPAGKLDPGESPRECAKRELQEETGFSGEDFIRIGAFVTTPAFTNEVIHLFLARNLTDGTAATDFDEFINTVKLPLDEVLKRIEDGTIMDAKTIIAFLLALKLGLL